MIEHGAATSTSSSPRSARNPADDMLSRLTQVTVDRGDGVETGLDDEEIAGFATLLGGAGAETVTKLVGNAVVLFDRPPRPVAGGRRRPARASRTRSRRSSGSCRRRSTRAASRSRTATFEGGTIPAGYPVLLLTGAATRDPAPSSGPTTSTSTARRRSPSASATACTAASARRWPAWRAASPSRSSRRAGRGSRSTTPASGGSTCRTSPATRTSRSPRCADRRSARPRRGRAREAPVITTLRGSGIVLTSVGRDREVSGRWRSSTARRC